MGTRYLKHFEVLWGLHSVVCGTVVKVIWLMCLV